MSQGHKSASIRRRHTNSKLGCLNCKRKKVRCDENLPECHNCSKAKKDKCSYLSLNQTEINKIKLTHSLRNSQNKLLDSNYRLPTSKSVAIRDKINKLKASGCDRSDEEHHTWEGIEFKHELIDLPIRIPSYDYPPLQYKVSTINDFGNEFRVIYDTPEREEEIGYSSGGTSGTISTNPQTTQLTPLLTTMSSTPSINPQHSFPKKPAPLPNALHSDFSFPPMSHKSHVFPNPFNEKFLKGSHPNIGHIFNMLIFSKYHTKHLLLLTDLLICLGRCIIMSSLKRDNISILLSSNNFSNLSLFNRSCFEDHSKCLVKMRCEITKYNSQIGLMAMNNQVNEYIPYLQTVTPLLYFGSIFLSYCVLLLDFSMENYNKISSDSYKIMEKYLSITNNIPNYNHPDLIGHILKTLQHQFLFVKIPGYDIQYSNKLVMNLQSLAPTFDNLDVDENQPPSFIILKSYYQRLIQFITQEYIPVIKDPFTYQPTNHHQPVNKVFNLLKKWSILTPGETFSTREYQLDLMQQSVIQDLWLLLTSYYYTIGISLKSSFPFATYQFGITFNALQVKMGKAWFTVRSNHYEITKVLNLLDKDVGNNDMSNILQRHIFFNLRMFSFFSHRFKIYLENSQWNSDTSNQQKLLGDRCYKNIQEKPIKDFNLTLIRPEHYPTSTSTNDDQDQLDGHKFIRYDESMSLKLYTRNIETLDFFSNDYVLQFDFESMCLLRDYRPLINQEISLGPLTAGDIENYLEDRKMIVKQSRQGQ